jgi:hypothetical protein
MNEHKSNIVIDLAERYVTFKSSNSIMFFICKEKEKHGDGIPCEINAASYQIK